MKKLVVVLTVLACLPAAAQKSKQGKKVQQAVVSAISDFSKAAAAGDRARLEALLSDDLVYSHSNARVENKEECIKALVETKPTIEFAPEQRVRVYGRSAVVRGNAKVNMVQNGQPTTLQLNVLQVWVRDGETWRLVARQSTRLP